MIHLRKSLTCSALTTWWPFAGYLTTPTKHTYSYTFLPFSDPALLYSKLGILDIQSTNIFRRQCWRLRHTAAHCRSSLTCSFCSSTEHTRADCTAMAARCVNCKGAHSSTSPTCPEYPSLEKVSNWSHRLICLSSPGRTN